MMKTMIEMTNLRRSCCFSCTHLFSFWCMHAWFPYLNIRCWILFCLFNGKKGWNHNLQNSLLVGSDSLGDGGGYDDGAVWWWWATWRIVCMSNKWCLHNATVPSMSPPCNYQYQCSGWWAYQQTNDIYGIQVTCWWKLPAHVTLFANYCVPWMRDASLRVPWNRPLLWAPMGNSIHFVLSQNLKISPMKWWNAKRMIYWVYS